MVPSQIKLEEILKDSTFAIKLSKLLEKPLLGNEYLNPKNRETKYKSNCWGTTAWVLNIENEILNRFKSKGYFVRSSEDRPGYIDGGIMEAFLTSGKLKRKNKKAISGIVSFWVASSLVHTGVYLGQSDDHDLIFHQSEYGGPFEITSLESQICRGYSYSKLRFHSLS